MSIRDPETQQFCNEEEAYRRGYTHGILASIEGITVEQAYEWRNSEDEGCPPGTPGHKMGLFSKNNSI